MTQPTYATFQDPETLARWAAWEKRVPEGETLPGKIVPPVRPGFFIDGDHSTTTYLINQESTVPVGLSGGPL